MRLLFTSILLLVSAQISATPITLFDNGSVSGTQGSLNNFDMFTIYDDFVLDKNSVITAIKWHQTEQKPEYYLYSTLTIFNDVPSDASVVFTLDISADRVISPIDDWSQYESLPSNSVEASVSVSGIKLNLVAGNYWLGINNQYESNGASQWSQTVGTTQTNPGRMQGETTNCGLGIIGPFGGCLKSYPNQNSAFQLIGRTKASVPEPATLALMSLGLLGLLGTVRKRKVV